MAWANPGFASASALLLWVGMDVPDGRSASLFSAIESLEAAIPFSKKNVSDTLRIADWERAASGGDDVIARSVALGDGIVLAEVDLRLRGSDRGGFLHLTLGGRCVTAAEVEGRFGPVETIRPRYSHPWTVPDAKPGELWINAWRRAWGEIYIVYRARPELCVDGVSFHNDP